MKKNKTKQPKKCHLHWPSAEVTEVNARRPAVEVTAVFCGHGRWSWRSRAEADGHLVVKMS